jgi:hypothetical protein
MSVRSKSIIALAQHFAPPIALLAVTLIFIVSAHGYSSASGTVPLLIGYSLILLILLDILSRTSTSLGIAIRRLLNPASDAQKGHPHEDNAPVHRELIAIGWVAAFTAAVMLFGILVSVPVYIAAYMMVQGRKSMRLSILVAAATTLFLWLGFEVFLSIPLYRGLLFES